ncbi:hypothetical protein I4U23_014523 [Adineta vaga]|nr:hypothetical protein I4U23_014523 [Adineta vaga]
MSESVNERGSLSSDLGDVEISSDDMEFEDQRLRFFLSYLQIVYGTTPAIFKKAILYNEINRKLMESFLDKSDQNIILIFENSDSLNILTEFPLQIKSKLVCFVKRNSTIIYTDISLKKQIAIAEFTHSSMTQLSLFISEILWPILQQQKTTSDWPDIIIRNCTQNISELTNLLTIVNGILRGRTILSIPHEIEFLSNPDYLRKLNHGKIRLLENLILTWKKQIQTAINYDSDLPQNKYYPLPNLEIDFWTARAENLHGIKTQVYAFIVNSTLVEILEVSGSNYFSGFRTLFRDIIQAFVEAQNIALYLKPFVPILDLMEKVQNIESISLYFDQLFHTLALTWTHSVYHTNIDRFIGFLQQWTNLILLKIRDLLQPNDLFVETDFDEPIQLINLSIETCVLYKKTYQHYKELLPTYFNDRQVRYWEIPESKIFERCDHFVDRLKMLKDIVSTAQECSIYESIELGGVDADELHTILLRVLSDFKASYAIFRGLSDDLTTDSNLEFPNNYKLFCKSVAAGDERISNILRRFLQPCTSDLKTTNIDTIYRLFRIFGSTLERSQLKHVVNEYMNTLLNIIEHGLNEDQCLFDDYLKDSHSAWLLTMPKLIVDLTFADQLRHRINNQIEPLKIINNDTYKRILEQEQNLLKKLDDFTTNTNQQWITSFKTQNLLHLNEPLLRKDNSYYLVNIKSEFDTVLHEVMRLYQLPTFILSPEIEEFYQYINHFQQQFIDLDYITKSYRHIYDNILIIEYPLIRDELQTIEKNLDKASTIHTLNIDTDSTDFIRHLRTTINDFEERLFKSKSNLDDMQRILKHFIKTALYSRGETRQDSLLIVYEKEDKVLKRNNELRDIGVRLQDILKQNKWLFKADSDSDIWKAYVDYVDEIIIESLYEIIEYNLNYLLEESDPSLNKRVLFEVQLVLDDLDLRFNPSLDFGSANGLYDIVDTLIGNIFRQAAMLPRLAEHSGQKHYQNDLEEMKELNDSRLKIMERLRNTMKEANDWKEEVEENSYLWLDDRKEHMRQFLLYGRILEDHEVENLEQVKECPPNLLQFQNQIDLFQSIYNDIDNWNQTFLFNNWLRVDARPVKRQLLALVTKWINLYKNYLIDHITVSLNELQSFIKYATDMLHRQMKSDNLKDLIEMMTFLSQVRARQEYTDDMAEPIKDTIELLKSYAYEVPQSVYAMLDELPEQWIVIKKLATQMKQQIAPLQANQVANIRSQIVDMERKQQDLRERFSNDAPFKYDTKEPYVELDYWASQLRKFDQDVQQLTDLASIFDINIPEYKIIKLCRKEMRPLKHLWDLIYLIRSRIDEWTKTPWKQVNIELIDQELRQTYLNKELRLLSKECNQWNTYQGIEKDVKNLIASLRSVGEFRNNAIRPRHWEELMKETGVQINMTDDTSLQDLLVLNLHKYEDEVKNIVDKAAKEQGMEKILIDLENTWSNMNFQTEKHPRTNITLVSIDDDILVALDEHQTQLQTLLSSKFISHFIDNVITWKSQMSTADMVLQLLTDVQRTWSNLEAIFIGTDDIRIQLPHETEAFDRIDQEFKAIAKRNEEDLNFIRCTNRHGLYDQLEKMKDNLQLCQKALEDYLEIKRLAFPRFFFVSGSELLEFLSNGNEPEKVMKLLKKVFDSLNKLDLRENFNGIKSKMAYAMYSDDGERVSFFTDCNLDGAVEIWLSRLLDFHCETIRNWLRAAVTAYEDKLREEWIFDYPAQIILTASQIWWTTDVNGTFARMEEGFSNALREYNKKQIVQLNTSINLLLSQLNDQDREKITTLCLIDLHARDVVAKLLNLKIENSNEFTWQSQLRHRWDTKDNNCYANICDARFKYQYEYLGNKSRLVITPLTDRCYITLTQSLHLFVGGAPAGPAGTGKTETTKDLGRSLGICVFVTNCSEQIDYKSIGNTFKGLAMSGCWGCFDEFNRISIAVLSVVAVQVKLIFDALRAKRKIFNFMNAEIKLHPSVGIFITMNPGYAGRTELPENLKALFRPCAMVVPDFELIAELNLVSAGFTDAKLLSRKFVTLYSLCRDLLSKQEHYDWGLRAIKSVLVVAGTLRRADPDMSEDKVLMRALRDFNIPKITVEDMPVFLNLIGDLFPALDVERKRDQEFETKVREAAVDLHLQAEEASPSAQNNFVLKIVQLKEIFDVRHSVFIIGNAGTGKTQIWKTLFKTYQNMKRRPYAVDLDPKAVTNDELFGYMHRQTREWKDGLFSTIMRDLANMTSDSPKWIVLDGDIDPMWIESLNTVMDDNKVLTLASNERIPLNETMRLLFEISHLKTATPATVSRAGILYVSTNDIGYSPLYVSWIEQRESSSERNHLLLLFDKYIPRCLELLKSGRVRTITPLVDVCHIQMLCNILDCLLTPQNLPSDCPKEWWELYFVWATVWAIGGSLFQEQTVDYRNEFSKWFIHEFKTIKFPLHGTIFDYTIDSQTKRFEPWSKLLDETHFDPELPIQSQLIPTNETVRLSFWLEALVKRGVSVMFVGSAGTDYTTSEMLQNSLEKPLEKKAGRTYGAPGNRQLIYFIDDFNMPERDKYFTVQAHTIVREYLDYQHWYDRQKLTLKDIRNCQFIVAMNQNAGTFNIDARLQRHFATFAIPFPNKNTLHTIYSKMLETKFTNFNKIDLKTQTSFLNHFITILIQFHQRNDIRFGKRILHPQDLIRLYIHEAERTYSDKLINQDDIDLFHKILRETIRKNFEFVNDDTFVRPLIYSHFSGGIGDAQYTAILSMDKLQKIVEDALISYNETNSPMNLVLFEDALIHVARINRILEAPRGNALLIGVGGSGKQSLARLAAFVSSLDIFQITIKPSYGINDFKVDLNNLYRRAGLKGLGSVLLLSDAQIKDEHFLVFINDYLSSGEIFGLFMDDEIEEILNSIRSEAKSQGYDESNENVWKYFIDKVRRNLKIVMCFSPVGNTLRTRARRFPALFSGTIIDWFHSWPKDALYSVVVRFLDDYKLISNESRKSIANFMADTHIDVNQISIQYFLHERRSYYTTPKTFLEFIKLFQHIYENKQKKIELETVRLLAGLEKLGSISAQTAILQEDLKVTTEEVNTKAERAEIALKIVTAEADKVAKEKSFADEERRKIETKKAAVEKVQAACAIELAKAEPVLEAARLALENIEKGQLTELKSFASPPEAVKFVMNMVVVLFKWVDENRIIPESQRTWTEAKNTIGPVEKFLQRLKNFQVAKVTPQVRAIIDKLNSTLMNISKTNNIESLIQQIALKSAAAGGIYTWLDNTLKFHTVYLEVKPKQVALDTANEELSRAQQAFSKILARVQILEDALTEENLKMQRALAEKDDAVRTKERLARQIDLAERLVDGLASSRIIWTKRVETFKNDLETLVGDVLLASTFISYAGYFSRSYRMNLVNKWRSTIIATKGTIPMRTDLQPLSIMIDDADIAEWMNQGLPADQTSYENAAILTYCLRWPLMVDPQGQGLRWIKNCFTDKLVILRYNSKSYLDRFEACIRRGDTLLLECVEENIDSILEPIISRNLIRKGQAVKLGDKEIDYHSNFRLIMQTRLANPHFQPEVQAQTTLINFSTTRDGLEAQLLAEIVAVERPDLEKSKFEVTKQQNEYKINLKKLEDSLLARLATAEGNFIKNVELVVTLEHTVKTALEIEQKKVEAEKFSQQIDRTRELYRPTAIRACIIYFLMNDLSKIHPMYQFSLKAFRTVFLKAIDRAEQNEDLRARIENLIDAITFASYSYIIRGVFEEHKLIFTLQLLLQILTEKGEIDMIELDLLLRNPQETHAGSPVEFLNEKAWGNIKALALVSTFHGLDREIETSSKRWKKYVESEAPELEKPPGEWKSKSTMQQLCILRAVRPDRMLYALKLFIGEKLGKKYTEIRAPDFAHTYEESSKSIPIFFILSPGVDPLKEVETLGKKLGYTSQAGKFYNISLGQGQEIVAENALEISAKEGHWVVLQNIHLVRHWLPILERKLERILESGQENFRLYMSAEPSADVNMHVIPQGILESSIKITNESHTGMLANLHKALDNFDQEVLDSCSKDTQFKVILFALCYFHAVVSQRTKFGPIGWNRKYPFSSGDLQICIDVLRNYLESNVKIPWEDLRYIFGEIMYGGHITDDWDRRLCRNYLETYLNPSMFEGDLQLASDFPLPPSLDYKAYHAYIDDKLPSESPKLYGLHHNAEIDFLSQTSEKLFRVLMEISPRETNTNNQGQNATLSRDEKIRNVLDELQNHIPEDFSIVELRARLDERNPYAVVALQEAERMNNLLREIRQSLKELDGGLKGELAISNEIEILQECFYLDLVPIQWANRAYPSLYSLGLWFHDMLNRYREIDNWIADFQLPNSIWLGGLFNPQSFLTSIMQSVARKQDWPLDRMCLMVEVTKKQREEIQSAPKDGAYIHNLFIDGARWDKQSNLLIEGKLKELCPPMPVIFVKAIPIDRLDTKGMYDCPVYRIKTRGPTYIWRFNLKTKEKPSKWVLAGVALLLQT